MYLHVWYITAHAGDENHPTLVLIALTFGGLAAACASVMFMSLRSTASMAFLPASKMLVMAWCAHVGSSVSEPRTRRAAFRAVGARSFMELEGLKPRMAGERSSVIPTSLSNSAIAFSDSLNAACCASAVLQCSSDKSSALTFSSPEFGSRRERSWQSHSDWSDSAPSEM